MTSYAEIAAKNSSLQNTPPAFLCTISKKIMEDPHLALCSHLFDKSVLPNSKICPIDQSHLNRLIPLKALQAEIVAWKAAKLAPPVIASTALQEKSDLTERFSSLDISNNGASSSTSFETKNEIQSLHTPKRFRLINNAHQDDIHGLIRISEDLVVSGSKDTTIKVWDLEGNQINHFTSPARGYEHWVTALSPLKDGWASGTRDGYVTIWDSSSYQISSFDCIPSQDQHKCKDRNKHRVNCIAESPGTSRDTFIYVGTPVNIQLWNVNTQTMFRNYRASDNDWVYCIEVLENRDLLVVIGSELEKWGMSYRQNPKKFTLIRETQKEHFGHQRPHISSITRLQSQPNYLSAARFDGTVKLIDIVAQKNIATYCEHQGRVWSVQNLNPQQFISGADDRKVKVWDIRQSTSALTLFGHPGRVSTLLKIHENIFIAGSCPDNIKKSGDKASLSFWDLRMLDSAVS